MAPKKNKRSKIELVFDPKERQEFLTGFSKRKQARKNAARADIERKFKEEVARIKKEKRESIQRRLEEVSSVKRSAGIELIHLARNENNLDKQEVLDLPQHIVTITSTEELDFSQCKDDAFLGSNSSSAVEVVEAPIPEESGDNDHSGDMESPVGKEQSKTAKMKSAAKVAALGRKAQMLKTKKKPQKLAHGNKISKSQKKFLKKHHKHKKSKPSR